jgi:hypothetical protein
MLSGIMDYIDDGIIICGTGRNIDFKSFINTEEVIPTKKSAIRHPQSVILYLSASL